MPMRIMEYFTPTTWRPLLALGLVMMGSQALAQGAPPVLPGAVQPGRDRPLPQLPTQPQFDFSIEAPHRSAIGQAVDEVRFVLKDIQVSGAKTLSQADLRPLYQRLIGKEIRLADILDVADAIEQAYRRRGYILVRAYVPAQRVSDGIFTINVVEGSVVDVAIQGGTPGTQRQVRGYLQKSLNLSPLPLATMERSLLLTNDLPGIAATGVLRPSQGIAGASDIAIVIDQPGFAGGLGVDNRGSRFSGLWSVNADLEVNSLFGADQLGALVVVSPKDAEQIVGQLRYRTAVGDDGLMAGVTGTITRGQPGSTLTAFGIFTESWALGAHFSYPLIRNRAETLQIDWGFTAQDAAIELAGTQINHDRWRVLDASITYLWGNWLGASWLGTLGVAQGVTALDATQNGDPLLSRDGGRTDFTKLTGFGRMVLPLPYSLSAVLTGQGQFSFSPLLNGELISFGGGQIGRGYDPGGITGDHGLGGSLELRYDAPWANSMVLALQPYLYMEGGSTWYVHQSTSTAPALPDQSIASLGGGARAALPHGVTLGLEVSQTLLAVSGSDAGRKATKLFVTAGIRF